MTVLVVLALTGVLQALPKRDFVAEGTEIGRLAEAMQVCRRQGYPVNELAAEDIVNRFAARAVAAGWSRDAVGQVFDAGTQAEQGGMPFSEPLYDLPADELQGHADGLAERVRLYCHAFAGRLPGAITDLETGDKEVAARLAHARRAAADILSQQRDAKRNGVQP